MVLIVRVKVPAVTEKIGISSLGEGESVNAMCVNVTLHFSFDATNTPLPFTPPITSLYTDPLPLMVSEVIEGKETLTD